MNLPIHAAFKTLTEDHVCVYLFFLVVISVPLRGC